MEIDDDFWFRQSVLEQIKKINEHIDRLYNLVQDIQLEREKNSDGKN